MTQVPRLGDTPPTQSRRGIIFLSRFRKWLSTTRLFSSFSKAADTRAGSSTSILDIRFPRRLLLSGSAGAAATMSPSIVPGPAGTTETLEMALTRLIVPIKDEYMGQQFEFLTFKLLPCIHHSPPSEVTKIIIEESAKDPNLVASALDFLTQGMNGEFGADGEHFRKAIGGPLHEAICSPELPPAVKDKIASKPNVRKFLDEYSTDVEKPQRRDTDQNTENIENRERVDILIDQSLLRDIPMMLNYFHRALGSNELSDEARVAILEEIDKRRGWLIEIGEVLEE